MNMAKKRYLDLGCIIDMMKKLSKKIFLAAMFCTGVRNGINNCMNGITRSMLNIFI